MTARERYDLAIVGAGSAGLIAADFAARLGLRVALIERERIGGDCTWTGCVPSKALIKAARVAHGVRDAARFGIHASAPVTEMGEVRAYVRQAIDRVYAGTTPEALAQRGIEVLAGMASFVEPHVLRVRDRRVRAHKIVIAPGAEPVIPPVAGLAGVRFATYRDIFDRDTLPHRLIVLGGGPLGVELAHAYARLGSPVTMFAPKLLPREEPEASDIIAAVLRRENVELIAERVEAVEPTETGVAVRGVRTRREGDVLLVAAGRRPAIAGLQLEAAGVRSGERGIVVDEFLRTSAPHVYAAGDVVGAEQYSHLAGWHGFVAARNAVLPGRISTSRTVLPRVTFTDPEVARVGQTEAQARASGRGPVTVSIWPIAREDRAVCDGELDGTIKLVSTRGGRLLGATVVSHRAGEVAAELALAMQQQLSVGRIAMAIHPYPTYASALQRQASSMAVDALLAGPRGALVRMMARLATAIG